MRKQLGTGVRLCLALLCACLPPAWPARATQARHEMWSTPDRLVLGLEGPVRTVRTEEFRVARGRDGRTTESRINSKTDHFDPRGYFTESFDGDEPEGGRFVFKHDAEGRLAEASLFFGDQPFARDVNTYDPSRRSVETRSYDFTGRLIMRQLTTHDAHGNEVRRETERYGADGRPEGEKAVFVTVYDFDARGRLVGSSTKDGRGRLHDRQVDELDETGRRVKGTSYTYDQASGAVLTKTVTEYDARGEHLGVLTYDPRGALRRRETYAREYDARGNWTVERRTHWYREDGAPPSEFTTVRRRTITYY